MMEAHDTALSLLRERRAALDEIVRRLLDREVVEGEEVRSVLAKAPGTSYQAA
jgi:ATP-dependent Zn protease